MARLRTAFIATVFAADIALASPVLSLSDSPLERGETPPDWAVRPTSDQTDHVYPELANDLGLGGHVMLQCRIDSRGLVERCAIRSENPPGLKFGRAALRLTPLFRFRPAMTITGPMPATINIPVRFVPPPDDIRRAIPFMALLAAFTTAITWRRRRSVMRGLIPAGHTTKA
jgi:TonB family protein